MVIFKWNKNLETGIETIDKHHRQIIETANTFFIKHKCGDKNAVNECLSFLQQYVMYHFQFEEAFQVDTDYPKYRHHQAQHGGMATKVKFFTVKLLQTDFADEEVGAFYTFLIEWIKHHILTEDLDFAKFYTKFNKKNRIASSE